MLSHGVPFQHLKMVFPESRSERPLQRYNDRGLRLVVGCIPYRFKVEGNEGTKTTSTEMEVLAISSPKSQEMMFPKGGWELNESIEQAATRETLEEAGVLGNVEHELGEWIFKSKSQEIYHVGHMFPLLVTEELDSWPEKNFRERGWMTVDKAKETCKQWWMKEALDKLVSRVHHDHQSQSQDGLSPSDQSSGVQDVILEASMEENVLQSLETNIDILPCSPN